MLVYVKRRFVRIKISKNNPQRLCRSSGKRRTTRPIRLLSDWTDRPDWNARVERVWAYRLTDCRSIFFYTRGEWRAANLFRKQYLDRSVRENNFKKNVDTGRRSGERISLRCYRVQKSSSPVIGSVSPRVPFRSVLAPVRERYHYRRSCRRRLGEYPRGRRRRVNLTVSDNANAITLGGFSFSSAHVPSPLPNRPSVVLIVTCYVIIT